MDRRSVCDLLVSDEKASLTQPPRIGDKVSFVVHARRVVPDAQWPFNQTFLLCGHFLMCGSKERDAA